MHDKHELGSEQTQLSLRITSSLSPHALGCLLSGSLSARVLSFYGDTPRGMVESAIEFADICRSLDYHNFVFSMKASNPLVMVQAYRLLAAEQYRLGPSSIRKLVLPTPLNS